MTQRVQLVHVKAATSIFIQVEITDEGDLLFSGQDVGVAPKKAFGDSDYEYRLRIRAEHKDLALLAFIEKLYVGNPGVISDAKDYLEFKGIATEFSSYA